jgi:hypothetical protein
VTSTFSAAEPRALRQQRAASLAGVAAVAGLAGREGRAQPAASFAKQRDDAFERLATIVAALEMIRAGLQRLGVEPAPAADVTEAIEAAMRLGRELEIAAEARAEVSAALRPHA